LRKSELCSAHPGPLEGRFAIVTKRWSRRRVARSGRPIDLGPTEYRLLEFFLEHPGRVFSREQLLDSVWGRDIYIDERTVDVHIGRLRKLLNPDREQDPIRTVRGASYALDDRFAKAEQT
jgi:two-component system phosphate regulon response regulator PhoB